MAVEPTKSAKLSSSCPIKLLLCLHRATFPSMKSKNKPNGMKPSAAQAFPKASGGPRQYRIEQTMDMKPQKPILGVSVPLYWTLASWGMSGERNGGAYH